MSDPDPNAEPDADYAAGQRVLFSAHTETFRTGIIERPPSEPEPWYLICDDDDGSTWCIDGESIHRVLSDQ